MAKIYTMPEIGIIIDGIYRNYSKAKIDQKNVNKLAADCNTSANVLMKVRNILAEMQQIIIEGERAQQKCYWNTSKCAPNPALLTEVYRTYTKDVKSRVKVEKKSKQCWSSRKKAGTRLRCLKLLVMFIPSRQLTCQEWENNLPLSF